MNEVQYRLRSELRAELWALRDAAAQIRMHLKASRRIAALHAEPV